MIVKTEKIWNQINSSAGTFEVTKQLRYPPEFLDTLNVLQ